MKYVNDVIKLSGNAKYMGVVFQGTMDEAIEQARNMPDHGLAEQYTPKGISRDRAALLQHLNLLETEVAPVGIWGIEYAESRGWL